MEKSGAIKFPYYRRHNYSPQFEPPGIAISCPAIVTLSKTDNVLPLYGSFAVPAKTASEFSRHLMQAAVILIRGPQPATLNVGREELLFGDDLVEEGEMVRGFFSLDLFDFFNLLQVPNRYHVSASIFQYISSVLTVDVVR